MGAISKRIVDRADFDRATDETIERLTRELSGEQVHIVAVELSWRKSVTAVENPDRLKRGVEVASVHVSIDWGASVHHEFDDLTLVETGAAWKILALRP